MSILTKTATQVAKEVAKEAIKRDSVPKLLNRSTPEEKKTCRVCDQRVDKDAQWVVSRRFMCRLCGHRTHVHCSSDVGPDEKICRSCANERVKPKKVRTAKKQRVATKKSK